ncbi:MAG: D-alanyl-D-alanine carboxypeptidase/D-alanyl-D-alanine endopeptidase, partial [Microcystaceae cyanobacterium]
EAKQPLQIRGLLAGNKLVITGELSLGNEESNGMAIPNPSQYFLESLEQVLAAQEIQVIALSPPTPLGKSPSTAFGESPPTPLKKGGVDGRNHQNISKINRTLLLNVAGTSQITNEKEIVNSPSFLRNAQTLNTPPFLRGAGGDQLGEIGSLPLSEIIKITNQDSNNLYAEALLNSLKNQANSNPEPIKITFKNLGLNPDSLILKDGSGLARQNLVSPRFFNQVLLQLAPNQTYRNSLAIAGQSGTLKNRFVDTPLAGKLQGKTGTLSGVSSLSGYFTDANNQPFVFSILVNNANLPSSVLRETIDQILLLSVRANCDRPI